MPHDKQEPGEWSVYDSNARREDPNKPGEVLPRTHESRAGRPWPLRNNKPCYMPEADARVFLRDPAFRVHDEDDNFVPGLAQEALMRKVPTDLAPNLVIADLSELTTSSLVTRANLRTDGQKMSRATDRETLIQFLIDGLAAPEDALPPTSRHGGLDPELEGGMADKGFGRMLEDEMLQGA